MSAKVKLTLTYPAELQQMIHTSFAALTGWTERIETDDKTAEGYDEATGTIPNPTSISEVVTTKIMDYVITICRSEGIKAVKKAAGDEEAIKLDAMREQALANTTASVEVVEE